MQRHSVSPVTVVTGNKMSHSVRHAREICATGATVTIQALLTLAQTLGDRIALIRQTPPLGTVREPMSLRDFAVLVQERTGLRLDKDKLSRIERGVQPLDTNAAAAIASVDPLKRGAAWLAWGPGSQGADEIASPSNMDGQTPRLSGRAEPRDAAGEREQPRRRGGRKG